MSYLIQNRKPASVFRFFEDICAIPHPSYHEEKVADYLCDFAARRGLEYYRDNLHNVLIKKPATPDRADAAPILFQGHTDMVCVKTADSTIDFMKDGLSLYVDGDFLRANGTTLGADDGIAVATMLALLDGELSSHPALECLFTAAEEVGLDGAEGFDYSKITARKMINMDSEDLGIITAGCAGGLRSTLTKKCEIVPFKGECLKISMQGLFGGHSGVDICSGRANANKLMGRLLDVLLRELPDTRLVTLAGGSKDNAIPRECRALLAVSSIEAASSILEEEGMRVAESLSADDRGFSLTVETGEPEAVMLSGEDTRRAVSLLHTARNGVMAMSEDIPGLVETSRNLGVVQTDAATLTFVFSSRSSKESALDGSVEELDALAASLGYTARHYSRYPGWEYAKVSPLRDAYLRAFRDVTGRDAAVNVIHAGLECGIICSKLPDMDVISIGPSMHDIHSPDEALELSSTETFCQTLVRLMEIL